LFDLIIAAHVDDVGKAEAEQLIDIRCAECLEIVRPQQPTGNDFAAVNGRNPADIA